MTVRDLPIGMYGAVMGLAGLGLSARAAASVWPGVFRAPAYFTEPWILLAVLAFVVLLPCYVAKIVLYPQAARADFVQPQTFGFCGALPVGMVLVAGGIGPYLPETGKVLWWIALGLLVCMQVWALVRLLSGGIELGQANAGWLIILVGGIVFPGPGIALGLGEAARVAFGVSAAAAPMLMALLFYRATFGPPLAAPLRPTWFILLVPPALIYANGLALYPGSDFLEPLFFFALALGAALLVVSRDFLAWPFGPPWWAFTFPLDALAYAAARYAQSQPQPLWRGVCAFTLALATLAVALVLCRSILALKRKAS